MIYLLWFAFKTQTWHIMWTRNQKEISIGRYDHHQVQLYCCSLNHTVNSLENAFFFRGGSSQSIIDSVWFYLKVKLTFKALPSSRDYPKSIIVNLQVQKLPSDFIKQILSITNSSSIKMDKLEHFVVYRVYSLSFKTFVYGRPATTTTWLWRDDFEMQMRRLLW